MEGRRLCLFSEGSELIPSCSRLTDEFERGQVLSILGSLYGVRSLKSFPGASPVSLERRNLLQVQQQPYLVTLKSDGVRYILLLCVTRDGWGEDVHRALFINRSLEMYECEVWANDTYFTTPTLFDGELVWQNSSSGLQKMFLIFDAISVRGSCKHLRLTERLNIVNRCVLTNVPEDVRGKTEVLEQFIMDEDKVFLHSCDTRMCPKRFVFLPDIRELWDMHSRCSNKNDGLIFAVDDKVEMYTDRKMFKWKPRTCVTIDVEYNFADGSVFVGRGGETVPLSRVVVEEGKALTVRLQENEVIHCLRTSVSEESVVLECLFQVQGSTLLLSPIKERSDKKGTPNQEATVLGTIRNAHEDIRIEEIMRSLSDCDSVVEKRAAPSPPRRDEADDSRPVRRGTRRSKRVRSDDR